jgi:hypothetical protein
MRNRSKGIIWTNAKIGYVLVGDIGPFVSNRVSLSLAVNAPMTVEERGVFIEPGIRKIQDSVEERTCLDSEHFPTGQGAQSIGSSPRDKETSKS